MENINRNLLIECSPEANSKEVFDYLESKGENINPNYYKYATKTANTEWYFVGFNRTRKEWTVARKNHHSFYYTSVVLSKDFLGKTTSESYIGRTIKALVDNPNNTGLKKDETVKILLERLKTYVLDTTPKGNNGMIIQNPLDLSKWELVSDKVSVDTSISIPEYVECIEVHVYDSYETVKTKPLIENVHSVSVKLSTKKINNKFKF